MVSVVLPCFNAKDLIIDAINSIRNQTYLNWELIVVDDASTDNTVEVIRSIQDQRVRLIQLTTNGGYAVAMRAGIDVAQGYYIARMDGDDVSAPTRLARQVAVLAEHPEASLCGTDRFRILPGGKMFVDKLKAKSVLKWEAWNDLMTGYRSFTDASVMLRRDYALACGSYRTYQRSGMDVDLWLRVMEQYGAGVTIMEPLYGRKLDPGSLIFNERTFLINQVPRVLARQRKETGTDDVMSGKGVDLDHYKKQGWIKEGKDEDRVGLLYGSLVTGIWLGDRESVRSYYKKIREVSGASMTAIGGVVLRKILQRVRNNPYEKFST